MHAASGEMDRGLGRYRNMPEECSGCKQELGWRAVRSRSCAMSLRALPWHALTVAAYDLERYVTYQ
jgi:hypothetical protein